MSHGTSDKFDCERLFSGDDFNFDTSRLKLNTTNCLPENLRRKCLGHLKYEESVGLTQLSEPQEKIIIIEVASTQTEVSCLRFKLNSTLA